MQKKVLDYHYTTDPLHWGTLPCLPQQFSAKKETHGRETQGKKHTEWWFLNLIVMMIMPLLAQPTKGRKPRSQKVSNEQKLRTLWPFFSKGPLRIYKFVAACMS